ncbi:MAG: spondin domain-containing protein, partial [Bacteroidia bacterium]|nr:spondin domain-containing protein [Bacteroidia bacterium]
NSGLVSPFAPGAYNVGSTNEIFTIGQTASEALEDLAEDGSPAGYANAFNTPEGASAPAPIFPGESYSFTFTAESGNLSFATMLVQSNDWFIGADNIDLFPNGNALSQDITSMLKLYDAGTEVDEYAGAGNDQAPRQAGPDTGADEGGMVEVETSPSSNLPAIADYIKVTVTKN